MSTRKPPPTVGGHASTDSTACNLPALPVALVQPRVLVGQPVPLPVEASVAAKALRTAAYWLPDDQRAVLLEAAEGTERGWDGACCPVCEEVWCDDGCPLEDVRAALLRRG